jgi:hypothetical protein
VLKSKYLTDILRYVVAATNEGLFLEIVVFIYFFILVKMYFVNTIFKCVSSNIFPTLQPVEWTRV